MRFLSLCEHRLQDPLHEHTYCPTPLLASPGMKMKITRMSNSLLGAVDLAIDFATLGEYGLEPAAADASCRTRSGHVTDRQAQRRPTAARARRERCEVTGGYRTARSVAR